MEIRTVQKLFSVALLLSMAWVGLSAPVYGQLATSPWPMFRHDPQHTGRNPYRGPETPELKWEYETGGGVYSSPAVGQDGTVYVGSGDHWLYAINPDGSLKWKYVTGWEVYSSPAIGSDGTVYVGSGDGDLYAINPDGSLKWKYETGGSIWYSSPAIGSDGTVYVGTRANYLYAINPDGSLKWKYKTGDDVESSPAVGQDGTVYVGSTDNNFYAINPDGSLKWKYVTGWEVYSSPAIESDGTVYVGSPDKNLYAINPDGSLKWRYVTGGGITSSPAIGSDGTVYVGSHDKNLYAINPDGSLKWWYGTRDDIWSSPAIGADGTIYVGSFDRKIYAIGVIAPPGLARIIISPKMLEPYIAAGQSWVEVKAGKTPQFIARGEDAEGNAVDISDVVEWEAYPQIGTIEAVGDTATLRATTEAGSSGFIVVRAEGIADSIGVRIRPSLLERLVIFPEEVKVKTGGTMRFAAKGYDEFGNEVRSLLPMWWVIGDIGTIGLVTGVFTAGEEEGTGYVVAFHLPWVLGSSPVGVDSEGGVMAKARVIVESGLPSDYSLFQNHPNPFNPETTIRYDLPKACSIRLFIYSLTGQLIRTLVEGERSAGSYSVVWDGTDEDGQAVASGVYLYRLETGNKKFVETKRMVLIR